MSASTVHPEHINVLIWAGLQRQRPSGDLHWYYGNPSFRKLSVSCGRFCCCGATRRRTTVEAVLGAAA